MRENSLPKSLPRTRIWNCKTMGKQTWKGGNMLNPVPAVMVSLADAEGNANIITIAWAGTINTNPPMVSISVRPERYSCPILQDTGEFVINLTNKELVRACDYCGVTSGRNVNKFEKLGLTKLPMDQVKCPGIAESPVNIACKVVETKKLGSHILFLAQVVSVTVDDQYIDEKGKFRINESGLVCYSHGEYFLMGEKLGSFGYSIRRKAPQPETIKDPKTKVVKRLQPKNMKNGESGTAKNSKYKTSAYLNNNRK